MLRRKSAGGSEADCAQSCATVLVNRKRVSARRVIARGIWLGHKGSSAVGANVRFATTLFREITGILRQVTDHGIFRHVGHQMKWATARRCRGKLEEQGWGGQPPARLNSQRGGRRIKVKTENGAGRSCLRIRAVASHLRW